MSLPNGPYNPAENEAELLAYWLENKFYKPEYNPTEDRVMSTEEMKADIREAWALVCPPPNAYARPHIGNISGYAYQDAMARYARMQGKKVLVLPGKDHAGLEGEGVFVREVLEKQGRNKFDIKREDFYAEMMDFFMKNIDIARNDEKTIGLSADFDRDTFTLDPSIVDTVLDTFVEMYRDGRIYKGVRIVNWDPKARTAVADNQVEYKESQTPFFYFKYSFLQPEQKALELKHEYEGKGVLWKVKESDEKSHYLLGETHKGVKILGVGYDKVPADNEVNGQVIGIQMRLDGDFRLVVRGLDFDGDINTEIVKTETELFTKVAGSHIVLFSEHSDNKFYTNGFVIGTVRPETIFADTAIACDPKDDRYEQFVGKKIEVEFLGQKKTLNFIEDYAVDKDFGTGLLKVTPAHAVEDWEIAQRHTEECLPAIQVIGYDLRLNKLTGKYSGMGIKEARKAMIDDMREFGNLIFVDETYQNKIKIAERTKAPIEPLLSSQWYLKYDGIKEAAIEMVKTGEVTIHPDNMVKKFDHWMENLRDWAISRSLWWGYRLPVWYAGKVFEEIDDNGQVKEYINVKPDIKTDITIEDARLEDCEAMFKIGIDGWHDNFVDESAGLTLERIKNEFGQDYSNSDMLETYRRNIDNPNYKYFVAKEGKKVVGWLLIENLNTEDTKWVDIYIDRQYRGKSIGKLLFQKAIETFKDLVLDLAVPQKSDAVRFYKRLGFIEYSKNSDNKYGLPIIQMKRTPQEFGVKEELDYKNPNHLRVQKENPGEGWMQDENVLDTWFSSGQWVYATLTKYNLMDTFFPTSVLVSAHDILENWDSRMMMFTYFKHKQIPFKNLFLTGLVLGTDGQKMSKSKGNLIDMDKVRTEYGTDSVRMTYFYQNSAGASYTVSPDKLKNFKQFNNKIWNAAKFVLMNAENTTEYKYAQPKLEELKLENSKTIFNHIITIKEAVTKNIDKFEFGYATDTLYQEFWRTFCDIYIESSKQYLNTIKDKETGAIISEPNAEDKIETLNVLIYTLKEYIKMLHPFIPFITEKIWQELPKVVGDHKTVMYSRW